MATIALDGKPIHTAGVLPEVGSEAPSFRLTRGDLTDVDLSAFTGKVKVLNIVPSLDTDVCAASARRFNREAGRLPETVVLQISADLPFAQQRFCSSEGLANVVPLSVFRAPSFGKDYGLAVVDGPLAGLLSRVVIVLDRENRVVYTEQVPDIVREPDYDGAVGAVRKAVGSLL